MSKTLKSPREYFTLANLELTRAMDERLKVVREGRTPAWEREQYNDIENRFKKEADRIADAMMATAKVEADKLAMEHRAIRNRPHSPLRPKDGSHMVYHQSRINNVLDGLNEEDAIREFGFMVSILNDDEKPYLHIYEDSLMARMKDPAYKNAAKDEIFKHKSAKEKTAQIVAERAEKEVEELETLAALIRRDIVDVAKGEKLPTYDYQGVFEEVGTYQQPEVTEQTIKVTESKINPYDGETDNGDSE